MKRVALALLFALAFSSPASAILRPRFPKKASPPFHGQIIVIEDDALKLPAKKSPPKR